MKYLRLFADEDGERHVEKLQFKFNMFEYAPPAPAFGVSAAVDATRYIMVHFPANWSSELHPTPQRQLLVIISGHLEGSASDGTLMSLKPGDVLLMDDTTGKGHTARAMDGKEVHALMLRLE